MCAGTSQMLYTLYTLYILYTLYTLHTLLRASSFLPAPDLPATACSCLWGSVPQFPGTEFLNWFGTTVLHSPAQLGLPEVTLVPVLLLPTQAELLPAPGPIPPAPRSTLWSISQKREDLRQLSPAPRVNLSLKSPR